MRSAVGLPFQVTRLVEFEDCMGTMWVSGVESLLNFPSIIRTTDRDQILHKINEEKIPGLSNIEFGPNFAFIRVGPTIELHYIAKPMITLVTVQPTVHMKLSALDHLEDSCRL